MVSNVFIAFTEAQLIHIKNILTSEKLTNVVLISRFDVDNSLKNTVSAVFVINGGFLEMRRQWSHAQRELIEYKIVNLFIAHSFNIFSQGIQHLLLKVNKLNSLNIFPDGNLLFNDYSISFFDKRQLVKKVISYFFSSKYKMFKGNIISPFMSVNTVFTYLPEVTCICKNIKLIKAPEVTFEIDEEKTVTRLLVLGHRNQKAIPANRLLDVIKRNNDLHQILYKPHPSLRLSDDLFFNILKDHFKNNLYLIEDNSPVEGLIYQYPISSVFAVASSSLITLKISIPQVDVCYFGIEEYLGKHYNPLIKKQFAELGLTEWS
jgi:hypothetical protein